MTKNETQDEKVRVAVAARDVEWCKMLGFSEAGETPEFMRRELDSIIKDEPEIALAILAEARLWLDTLDGERWHFSDHRVGLW